METFENVPKTGLGRRPPHWFPIEQKVRYQCVKNSRASIAGIGKTLGISSREVRFTAEHLFKIGEKVRLAVDWPALLDNICLMKLEISGWVIQSAAGTAAIKIERYEFRTRGGQVKALRARSGR